MRLIGFAKVDLEAGEGRQVTIAIEPRALRIWQDGWQMPDGPTTVRVARSAEDPGVRVSTEI